MTLEEFKSFLEEGPPNTQEHPTGGYDFIPIGQIEADLDHISMEWSTSDFNVIVTNDMVFSNLQLELPVRDDMTRILLIRRTGAISFHLDNKPEDGDLFAVAKSLCLKNAVKSLGKRFGRDLNREKDDEVSIPGIDNASLVNRIYVVPDKEKLDEIAESLTDTQKKDPAVLKAINDRYEELLPKKKPRASKKTTAKK